MDLVATLTTRRPIHPNCQVCKSRMRVMQHWDFFQQPTSLVRGTHLYPFSYLFSGQLPATTSSSLASIHYQLIATVSPSECPYKPTVIHRPLKLARSILPGTDKTCQRIFPPTALNAILTIPNICHPAAHFTGTLAITGVQTTDKARWKLKKVSWRIDEFAKVVSPACTAHRSRVPGNKGGLEYQDTRTVGAGELREGWKTDFSAYGGGRVEMEIELFTHILAKPCCAVDAGEDGGGIVVSHQLILEAIVFEVALTGRNGNFTESLPSGSARVLKMQFPITMVERGGLGISWDNEVPPQYQDIPGHQLPAYRLAGSTENLPTILGSRLNIGPSGPAPSALPATPPIGPPLSVPRHLSSKPRSVPNRTDEHTTTGTSSGLSPPDSVHKTGKERARSNNN